MFLYNMFILLRKNGPKLKASRFLSLNFQFIESNAFSKSTVKIIPGVPLSSLKITSSICLILQPIKWPFI